MLANSPTMSTSGSDHTSGTRIRMSSPRPGPTLWISVSVVYGPPDVQKNSTKTSANVPSADCAPRGAARRDTELMTRTRILEGRGRGQVALAPLHSECRRNVFVLQRVT